MIHGSMLSANVGNFLPSKGAYTFSLCSEPLARLVHAKIDELSPDVCLLQEAWTFPGVVLGEAYEWLGLNDAIAVKRSFGRIVPGSFTSHSLRFTRHAGAPVEPPRKGTGVETLEARQRERLLREPYDGTPDNPHGIPVDFDVTTAIIEASTGGQFLVANLHVRSASWHDAERARQLREWVLDEVVPRSRREAGGRVIIGGDFNCDEDRQHKQVSAAVIKEILAVDGMNDASAGNKAVTTNLPSVFGNYRYDHLIGTATFNDYVVDQSLTATDLAAFKRRQRFTWWMHLDHKHVHATFAFP